MTVIKVPRPPASAANPNRAVSSLLKTQIIHLQEAEFRLPISRQTDIYINEIRTEGEAAEYIRQVTAMLHPQGAKKAKPKRVKPVSGRRFEIAASTERTGTRRPKKSAGKSSKKSVRKSRSGKQK